MKNATPLEFNDKLENGSNSESNFANQQEKMPSENTVENILNYSKALSVRKSKNFGFIENVLN